MPGPDVETLLRQLEATAAAGDLAPALAYLAGAAVPLKGDAVHGAVRRGVLLLAAGGDPLRDPDPDGRAARAVAADLETPERRAAHADAVAELADAAVGLPAVAAVLQELRDDPGRAWRWLAVALLADELSGDGDGDEAPG